MPLNTNIIVLKSKEATADKLTELYSKGYFIKEKIRQSDGTDSLILIKTNHVNVPKDKSVLQNQAEIAAHVERDKRPQTDANIISKNIDIANASAESQRNELTRIFKKKYK